MTTMKAVQVEEFKKPYHVSEVEKPSPRPHQVLLKMKAGGFCHSDIMVLDGVVGNSVPYIASHEPAGVIEELGSEVSGFSVGDRVGAIIFDSVCGQCPDCKAGVPKFCDQPLMKGATTGGAWADYMAADARFLIPIPDAVSFPQAAAHMCAGLTMYGAIESAIRSANIKKGGSIAIIGIGGLGHIGTQIGKAMGYSIVAVDTKQEALDLAMSVKNKPDICMNPKESSAEEVIDQLAKIQQDPHSYRGVDATILVSDQPASFKTGIALTKKHGLLVLVGQPSEGITLHHSELIFKDLRLIGSLLGDARQGQAYLELVAKEGIKVHVKEWRMNQVEEMRQDT